MKVLQILPELNSGGVERGTWEIARFLLEQGHEAQVVSNGGRMVQKMEEVGARHFVLPVHRKSLASLWQVRPLRRLLEREQPDILHIRSRVPGWIAWLAWRKMNPATRPHLVTTVHGFYSVNRYSAIMTCGERVIAVSDSIRDYIFENYPKTPRDNVRVIPRGITPSDYQRPHVPSADWLAQWKRDYPQLDGKQILLLPGRITRLKGHEDLFRLVANLRETGLHVHGLVVGDIHPKKRAYMAALRELVGQLGLTDDVTFTGHRNDLREIMAVSDVVYSLSGHPESFGRTTLEALAIGKPVVAYDHGGVAEQLREIFPQGLVPLKDGEALAKTTTKVLSQNLEPGSIPSNYCLETMCGHTLATYRELVPTR